MKKKFTSKGKKSLALVMALSLTFGVFITSDALMAEEEIPILTKEAFVEEVLKDNSTIADLQEQIEDMEDSLDSLSSYSTYLNIGRSLVGSFNSLSALIKAGTYTAEQYESYLYIGSQLAAFGVTGSTVTPVEEYELFIEPVFVTNRQLKSGIDSLEDGIISASEGFEVGANQLYNTVLMMNDLMDVLELSYETSKTNYESAQIKYDSGLLNEVTLNTSYNDMVSAQLSKDQMLRDIDNLKMSMNIMMGRAPTVSFEIESAEIITTELDPLSTYISEALEQRSEIIALNRSIEDQDYKKIFLKGTLSSTDSIYIQEGKQLEYYKMDLENTQNEITLEIRSAYNNVLEKETALEIAYLDLEDAQRQYNELAINVEQGFVTESTLNQMNLLVTSAVNTVASASRDYFTAVDDLTNASSFGSGN